MPAVDSLLAVDRFLVSSGCRFKLMLLRLQPVCLVVISSQISVAWKQDGSPVM